MRDRPMEAFATRLPASDADVVNAVIDETDLTDSQILRRAIRYYLRENPDNIGQLNAQEFVDQILADLER